MSALASWLLVFVIRAYQLLLSPWLAPACRFEPTCSHYAIEAIERYGPVHGPWIAAKRLARCHPLGDHGYDPLR